jgi:hypothetical protein
MLQAESLKQEKQPVTTLRRSPESKFFVNFLLANAPQYPDLEYRGVCSYV